MSHLIQYNPRIFKCWKQKHDSTVIMTTENQSIVELSKYFWYSINDLMSIFMYMEILSNHFEICVQLIAIFENTDKLLHKFHQNNNNFAIYFQPPWAAVENILLKVFIFKILRKIPWYFLFPFEQNWNAATNFWNKISKKWQNLIVRWIFPRSSTLR